MVFLHSNCCCIVLIINDTPLPPFLATPSSLEDIVLILHKMVRRPHKTLTYVFCSKMVSHTFVFTLFRAFSQ
uniref:Uncharacterized protein LOC106797893 n=1 Tax=Rhizophora mucronata TaxID=61149 RepID=A0A2P2NY94_RHIMU